MVDFAHIRSLKLKWSNPGGCTPLTYHGRVNQPLTECNYSCPDQRRPESHGFLTSSAEPVVGTDFFGLVTAVGHTFSADWRAQHPWCQSRRATIAYVYAL